MKVTRRTLLRGLLGGTAVSIGLPPLEAFFGVNGDALAAGGAIPKRFGLFFWGNGILPQRWVPIGEGHGDDWQLSDQLAPLAAVKSHLTVVSGMALKTENRVPHTSGAAGILSGSPLLDTGGDAWTFSAPSIDQVIAGHIGGDTVFKSLEVGVEPGNGLSYNGPHNLNPPESSPYLLFERVFGAGFHEPGEGGVDPTLALRRSVLDAVMEDAHALQGRVGRADALRVEQHLDSIRDLELRLARLEESPPAPATCAVPEPPPDDFPDVDGRPDLGARNRAMCDLLAMALACDQTRVFSHWFTKPVNNLLFPGIDAGHHQLTHDEPGDQPQVHAITVMIMEQLAYLVAALGSIEEGDGTVLDHSVVLATSETSLGQLHSVLEMPLLLAGSACGALRTDFHYRSVGADNANRVMLSVMGALDIVAAGYGNAEGRVTDALPDLFV